MIGTLMFFFIDQRSTSAKNQRASEGVKEQLRVQVGCLSPSVQRLVIAIKVPILLCPIVTKQNQSLFDKELISIDEMYTIGKSF